MSQNNSHGETELLGQIKKNAGMSVFLGIVMLVMGLLALSMPLIVGRSVTIIVGVVLVIAGIPQILFAFKMGSFGKGLWTFVLGALTMVVGLLMIGRPLFGLATLTFVLAAYFGVSGILDIVWAFKLKPIKGWGMTLFLGILSLLLGLFVWRSFPLSGARIIGFLVGIRLIFGGWSHIILGGVVRREAKKAKKAQTAA
jgi:uncharacterized membrane protein HdeD (DUF308 family)